MAKRKAYTKQQEQAIAVNDATHDMLYGTLILLACGNATMQLLKEDHGFTDEQAKVFVDKMIPLAVVYGSEAMGVDATLIAQQMAGMFSGVNSGEPIHN